MTTRTKEKLSLCHCNFSFIPCFLFPKALKAFLLLFGAPCKVAYWINTFSWNFHHQLTLFSHNMIRHKLFLSVTSPARKVSEKPERENFSAGEMRSDKTSSMWNEIFWQSFERKYSFPSLHFLNRHARLWISSAASSTRQSKSIKSSPLSKLQHFCGIKETFSGIKDDSSLINDLLKSQHKPRLRLLSFMEIEMIPNTSQRGKDEMRSKALSIVELESW